MRKNIIFAIFLLLAYVSYAQESSALWTQANEAYSIGEYNNALEKYNAIQEQGKESYNLYYNIGNCYYKMGETAKSIVYYERALKLNPSGKDAINNLEIARLQTLDQIEVVPEFILTTWTRDIRNMFSSNVWAYIALGLFGATLVFLLSYRFAPITAQRKLSFILACVTFLFMIFSVLFSANLAAVADSEDYAVVMVPVSSIKSAPNTTGNNLFILHMGTKIQILEQVQNWMRIELSDGRQGWMQSKDVEII
ncbi:MAG: tetratricopeptide repeat protein [Bacteroidia bacterium]|nr:tetratricopeptide repeat protein [Bacteroidia bacterium]